MLSKYLNELYNNNNRDPDPTQNPNEKFWNIEPGPEPGLKIFWTLDPYPNPQYQFCKTQKPDPPLNFIGFSSLEKTTKIKKNPHTKFNSKNRCDYQKNDCRAVG